MNEPKTAGADLSTGEKPQGFIHRLYVSDFSFDFMKRRRTWYLVSAVIVLVSILAVSVRGFNLGIEFKGGSVFQAAVSVDDNTIQRFRAAVGNSGVADLDAQVNTVGGGTVRVQTRSLSTDEVSKVRAAIAGEAKTQVDNVAYSLIGPSWGKQITQQAVIALVVFLVLVGVLIWIYFREWKMSLVALLALAHDLVVTVGLYALVGFSVTPATVIAVLTILGYSLYDTVVVFDMVRVQTKDMKNQRRSYSDAANAAINQVLARSINTTVIAVLPVAAILIAALVVLGGSNPLADLGLAMFIGMISGAYSSIFLATPLLAQLREKEPEMVAHRKSLEKSQRRAHAKVSATISSEGQLTPAGVPLSALAADRQEFAATEVAVTTVDSEADQAADPSQTGRARVQRGKGTRSSRK